MGTKGTDSGVTVTDVVAITLAGSSIFIDAARLHTLVRLGLIEVDNELDALSWDPEERVDAEGLQSAGQKLVDFLSPPSPKDDLPF